MVNSYLIKLGNKDKQALLTTRPGGQYLTSLCARIWLHFNLSTGSWHGQRSTKSQFFPNQFIQRNHGLGRFVIGVYGQHRHTWGDTLVSLGLEPYYPNCFCCHLADLP